MRRINVIKDPAGKVVGSHVRAKVVKKQGRTARFASLSSILCTMSASPGKARSSTWRPDLGVIEKKGSWLAFDGQQIGQGRESAKDFLRENGTMLDAIIASVRQKNTDGASLGKRIGGTE